MKYIGIDLAWTTKNETGICILDNHTCIFLDAKVYSDEDIVKMILEHRPCIVSIDAPLVVTNETGGRAIDSLLMKKKINGKYLKLYATSRSYMMKTFKAIRGEVILDDLKDDFILGEHITETYPTGVFLSLFPNLFDDKYKISSRLSLELLITNVSNILNEIKSLGFNVEMEFNHIKTKKAYKVYEDMFDSVLCALNSYYFDKQSSFTLKDDNGCLTLPLPITEISL
jgi:predicted RNase H-like nuclease